MRVQIPAYTVLNANSGVPKLLSTYHLIVKGFVLVDAIIHFQGIPFTLQNIFPKHPAFSRN